MVDLGCGEGILHNLVAPEKIFSAIHSYDLVQLAPHVEVVDIKQLPLESQSVNVAVFCLSLMGTNYLDFLTEAARVLKTGGVLIISEVLSRFRSTHIFEMIVMQLGFNLLHSVDSVDSETAGHALQPNGVQEEGRTGDGPRQKMWILGTEGQQTEG